METSLPSGAFLGPTQLFDRAWVIFEKKWKTMLVVGLPMVGFVIMWVVFIALLVGGVGAGMMINKSSTSALAGFGIAGAIVGIIGYVAFIVGCIWVQLAELYVIANHTREVTFNEAYGSTRKYILSLFWIGILTAAISVTGFIALIVPGIILAVWFIFAQYVLVDQNIRGLNALLTSREYVRGRWGMVFGRLVLFFLVYFVLLLLLSIVQNVGKDTALGDLLSILSLLVQMVMGLLASLYIFAMYENLKEIKGTNIAIAGGTRTKFSILGWVGIVLLSLGVLAPIGLLALNPAGTLVVARNATRVGDVIKTQKALTMYYVSANKYPESLPVLVQGGMLDAVPADPLTKAPLSYVVNSDGSDFRLCTHLEPSANAAFKKPLDANGDFCITSRTTEAGMMEDQYPSGASGTFPEGYNASGSGMVEDPSRY